MALPRTEVTIGLLEELERFKGLVQALTPAEWADGEPLQRLDGGRRRRPRHRRHGRRGRLPPRRARHPRGDRPTGGRAPGRSPAELADELGAAIKATADLLDAFNDEAWGMQAPGGFDFTLGEGVEALWHDAWLHGDDIRRALGRPSERGDGMKASVSHIADVLSREGWGPAVLALDGLPEFAVNHANGRQRQRRVSRSPATRWPSSSPPPAGPTPRRSASTRAPTSTGRRADSETRRRSSAPPVVSAAPYGAFNTTGRAQAHGGRGRSPRRRGSSRATARAGPSACGGGRLAGRRRLRRSACGGSPRCRGRGGSGEILPSSCSGGRPGKRDGDGARHGAPTSGSGSPPRGWSEGGRR